MVLYQVKDADPDLVKFALEHGASQKPNDIYEKAVPSSTRGCSGD
jgi:hypothetical protein